MENTREETLNVLTTIDKDIRFFALPKRALKRPSRLARMSNDELEDLVHGGRATTGDVKDLLKDGRLHVAARAIIRTARRGKDTWIEERAILAVFCGLLRAFSPQDVADRKLVTSLARVVRQASDAGTFAHHSLGNIALYARHFGFIRADGIIAKL